MMLSGILWLRTSKSHPSGEQQVGWLELFYDLVYVATVIALGNKLSEDVSRDGVLGFVVLFIPIWWSWTGMAFYVTRFNLDDIGHRLLIFAQMFAVAVLAINVHDGLGATSQGFALAYVGARAVLIVMYVRVGRQRPQAQALTTRYARGFSLAALIWLLSVFVPRPARFVLWGMGMLVDFGTPLLPATRRLQNQLPPDTRHLPDRFGLFTIIVLGEAFIKVITHASEVNLHRANALYGALALIVAAALWWIYFDNVEGSVVRRTRFAGQIWVYTHLPLVAAITVFGVAANKVVLLEPGQDLVNSYRLLMSGAIGVSLLAIAVLDLASTESARDLARNRIALVRLAGAVMVLAAGLIGRGMNAGTLLVLVALLCGAQVAADIYRRVAVAAPAEPSTK